MRASGLLKGIAVVLILLGCTSGTGRRAEARLADAVVALPPTGDLQRALDDARPGDTIMLTPGARYVGPFRLPRKDGDGWITIQTAASLLRKIPPAGTRVRPADATVMAKIVTPSGAAIQAEPGAHHYRFVGVEIAPMPGVFATNLIDLGNARTLDAVAHHLTFERCYIHGDPAKGSRRGVALNSGETTVRDSYLSDFKEVGNDSQALAGWNGPGPFHIVNNFLQGAGENVLFGGGDPDIPGLVPSDIEILRNTLSKPLEWRKGDPRYQGTQWTVKNILELKNARRVRIEGNILEYTWPQAQNGFAVLFTVRNQDGGSPWSTIEDVSFLNNVIRHVAAGVNILGRDDINQSQQARRILIRNNLFLDVTEAWGYGRLFQLLNGAADVRIDHNTAFQTETMLMGGDTAPHTGFVFENNIARHNEYGIIGSGTGVGRPTLERYFPGASVRRNVIAGGNSSLYPPDNFFPGSIDDVKWADAAKENFRLAPASPYRGRGTDGRDLGADLNAIQASMAGRTPPMGQDESGSSSDAQLSAQVPVTQAGILWAGREAGPETVAETLLIGSVALLAYAYVGYAAMIWVLARLKPRLIVRRPCEPSVTVVVIANNEAARIERRIANLLALRYPRERLEIVIASDGSTDETVALAARYQDRIRLIDFPVRRGKPAVLNDVIPGLRSEIVVLADARQEFDSGAVSALVRCFADESVGAVSGELILREGESTTPAAQGAAIYWTYEKLIRWSESQVDSSIGATGAIYAIRRALFEPIPPDTILDDVLIPLRITRHGYRVVFEPGARAYDRPVSLPQEEYVRKVRTIAGNAQLFARERWLFDPSENRLWLQVFSHKFIRLLLPALYVTAFAANLMLLDSPVYRAAMAGQVLFYLAALAACLAPRLRRAVPLLVVPYQICFLNWAALVGVVKYLARRQRVTWERPTAAAAS